MMIILVSIVKTTSSNPPTNLKELKVNKAKEIHILYKDNEIIPVNKVNLAGITNNQQNNHINLQARIAKKVLERGKITFFRLTIIY